MTVTPMVSSYLRKAGAPLARRKDLGGLVKLLRRKKFVIPAIVGIVALIGAGVAYGFFTTSGRVQARRPLAMPLPRPLRSALP